MPHITDLDLWANLPGYLDFIPFTTVFSFANTVIDGKVLYLFLTDQVQVQGIVYTGVMMALTMCFVSAAYVMVKTTEAAINWTSASIIEYAHKYRGGSETWGNNLGLFELFGIILFSLWSLMLTMVSLVGASQLWTLVETRELGAKTEGKFGEAFDIVQAMKFFTLCMIVGSTTIIGAFSLGDTAGQLITWFDEYADDTKSEASDKKTPSDVDPNGTSAKYDIVYHYSTLAMGYMLFSVITFGGHMFGMHFMEYADEIECDRNMFDDATKAELLANFQKFTSLEACYDNIQTVMHILDVNKNGNVDRCEEANFVMVLEPGNTWEYSIKYSHNQPLASWKGRCNELFNPLR